jgi:hypothetical protein
MRRTQRNQKDDLPAVPATPAVTTPRLRFDKVAVRLVRDVRNTLGGMLPDGLCVLFTVTAPIREPSKTAMAITEMIQAILSVTPVLAGHFATLHGNEVQVRVVASRTPHALRVAGFIHNPDPSAAALLDIAQSLLEAVEPADVATQRSAANVATLRRICGQVLDDTGCAKVAAAIGRPRARPAEC